MKVVQTNELAFYGRRACCEVGRNGKKILGRRKRVAGRINNDIARRCRDLGLAIPLTDSARTPVTERDMQTAMAVFTRRRKSMQASLSEAREWELEVMAGRDTVLRRITELVG